MGFRKRSLAVRACALWLLLGAMPALGAPSFLADTADVMAPNAPLACLALDPLDGTVHLGYRVDAGLRHTWGAPGSWTSEAITGNGSGLDLVCGPTGLLGAAYVTGGAVVFARPAVGVWAEDTVTASPGASPTLSLALVPGTDDPLVAWMATVPGSNPQRQVVTVARKVAGVWSLAAVDSFEGSRTTPSLAVAPDGSPRIAYVRTAATGTRLALVEAQQPAGPYVRSEMDPGAFLAAALAFDPASGEPRIAYSAFDDTLAGYVVRYAWREAGNWEWMNVRETTGSVVPTQLSLALDAFGDPGIAGTWFLGLAPQDAPAPGDIPLSSCGGVMSGIVFYASRVGGAGHAPFTLSDLPRAESDVMVTRHALARTAEGSPRVAYYCPRASNQCTQGMVFLGYPSPTVDVGPPAASAPALGPIAPNPWRPGAALAIPLALERGADVRLELCDLAGRAVARRAGERLAPGPGLLRWNPGPLAPGIYWLSAFTGDRRLPPRAIVVLR